MRTFQRAALLRIYTDEEAVSGDRALFAVILEDARRAGLAGATVLRGRMGFGQSSIVHLRNTFDLKENLPVVIEVIDEEEALRSFAAGLGHLNQIGLVTMEKVEVLRYGGHNVRPRPSHPGT